MDYDLSIKIAERLKMLRKGAGLSHSKLCAEIKERYDVLISRASLQNYEVTDRKHKSFGKNLVMNVQYIQCFADYYGVSTDYILGLVDDPTKDQTTKTVSAYTGLSAATVDYLHNAVSPSTRSFYRLLFDRIIQKGDYGLDDIPEMIRESAKARLQSQTKDSQEDGDRFQKCENGRIGFLPSDAEQYLLYSAQNELNTWLRDILLDMEIDCIKELKKTGSLQDDYIWQVSQSDLFRASKSISAVKGEAHGEQ